MSKKILTSLIFLMVFSSGWLFGQPFSLLKNISGQLPAGNSDPKDFIDANGTVFFSAVNVNTGRELWKTDGTDAGTQLVKDIVPGSVNADPQSFCNVNGILFFAARIVEESSPDLPGNWGLWKTDGTLAGTVLVRGGVKPKELVNKDGILYFEYDGTEMMEGSTIYKRGFWKSDGTETGTVEIVADLSVQGMINYNGTLYFSGTIGSSIALWKSDGTTAGTAIIKDNLWAQYITVFNGQLYFLGRYNDKFQLWKSDGSELGTLAVTHFTDSDFFNTKGFTVSNGLLYFTANDKSIYTLFGPALVLWKSDGTDAGTVKLNFPFVTYYSGGEIDAVNIAGSLPYFIDVDGELFFTVRYYAYDEYTGIPYVDFTEQWKTDGTEAGEALQAYKTFAGPSNSLVKLNGKAYFGAAEGLWESNGTASGTAEVKHVNTQQLASVGGSLYFSGNSDGDGRNLWKSNGLGSGTAQLKDINGKIEGSSNPYDFTDVNGIVAFVADYRLWKTDGTTVGTTSIPDAYEVSNLTKSGNFVYFNAIGGDYNEGSLWGSDLNVAKLIYVTPHEEYLGRTWEQPHDLTDLNGKLFFVADAGEGLGKEILTATIGGASLFLNLIPDNSGENSAPTNLRTVGNTMYFDANGGYKTDGTVPGTVPFEGVGMTYVNSTLYFFRQNNTNLELWVDEGGSEVFVKNISGAVDILTSSQIGNEFFFAAKKSDTEVELWKSNGTSAGTILVRSFAVVIPANPINFSRSLRDFIAINGVLFFVVENAMYGAELWKSNGTSAGTVLVKDIAPGTASSKLRLFAGIGSQLLFAADNGTDGDELWKSDGTTAGTVLAKDIMQGGASSNIHSAKLIGSKLVFRADDGIHGDEIWKSDGTAGGTVLVQDIEPGGGSSLPHLLGYDFYNKTQFFLANGKIYTAAYTTAYGTEPWVANDFTLEETDCTTPINRLYVNVSAAKTGTGANWQCAIKELRDAVAIANANPAITQIWVAKGTYKPTDGTDRSASIIITRGNLKILGGFAGNEAAASVADPVTNVTTVSGDIGMPGNMADNSYHLLRVTGLPAASNGSLLIEGFLFEKGNASNTDWQNNDNAYGGAILFYANNTAAGISVDKCAFTGNAAFKGGGAIGIYSNSFLATPVHLNSCVFVANTAANGGAVASYSGAAIFSKNIFSKNVATDGSGGAVFAATNIPSFDKTVFDGNTATVSGGGVYLYQTQATIDYSNCVFNGNTAPTGGGVQLDISNSRFVNNTFYGNASTVRGGAIASIPGAFITARNSIFYKNKLNGSTTVANADISEGVGSATGNYNNNILQTGTSVLADNGSNRSNNLRGADPMFVNEALPAGADGWLGYLNDGLELKNTSPAKNVGNNSYAAGIATDLLGKNRVACATVDLGAYENQSCATLITKSDVNMKEVFKNKTEATITNPFRNSLLIRYTGAEKADVDISTLTGQKIWKGTVIQKGQTQVNTASWPSGLYQVTLRTATSQPIIFKVIKAQ